MAEPYSLYTFSRHLNTLLEISGFATTIQLHMTHATAILCSYIRQVA
jgi:hypothetical protein